MHAGPAQQPARAPQRSAKARAPLAAADATVLSPSARRCHRASAAAAPPRGLALRTATCIGGYTPQPGLAGAL